MRKTIVETLFSLDYMNKLFEQKKFKQKKSLFPKSPIKVRRVYRFVGDYFDQKHISDFIGFFGANYGNSGC